VLKRRGVCFTYEGMTGDVRTVYMWRVSIASWNATEVYMYEEF
jgi:hypothetical protein